QGEAWEKNIAEWKTLFSDTDATFDTEIFIKAEDIEPMITYGTNPGMGIGITQHVPALNEIDVKEKSSFEKSLQYMGLQ
ncbi:aconitase family protein, partial [Acinetobacter baumannii]